MKAESQFFWRLKAHDSPVVAWNQLALNLITFRKNTEVVGLKKSFFDRITALATEEVGTCNFSCDGRDEAPSVVSDPGTRLVGEAKALKNREIGVEKPSPLFMCRLRKKVVHPKRDPGIRKGISVGIVGMIIASPAGIDGLASGAHLVSFFFINLK